MRPWFVRTVFGRPIAWLIRRLVALRYRISIHGLSRQELRRLQRRGGVLFLPNHPALIDPVILVSSLWPRFKPRPMIAENVYFLPGVHGFLKTVLHAIKVPNFQYASNSYKLRRAAEAEREVVEGLIRGENMVIYPAGRLKRTPEELIGGASAVHQVLQKVPDVEVVLVRSTGLWGSSFGWGVSGKQPYLSQAFPHGFRAVLKNLLFFTPRRSVDIELAAAPINFPRSGTRAELNGWLEHWYNRPVGKFQGLGEPLSLVSYSRWKEVLPEVTYRRPVQTAQVDNVPIHVRNEVIKEVCRIAKRKPSEIRPDMHLFTDVGLDSLDIAELISAIGGDQAFTSGINYDLLTVGGLMAIAADQFTVLDEDELPPEVPGWTEAKPRLEPQLPQGQTLHEAFLLTCERMGSAIVGADQRSGALSFADAKVRILILAERVRKMPSHRIGVMLPSSLGAQLVVLAIMLAGKVPVMINWTVGPRFLSGMVARTELECILTSFAFLDRLEGVDVTPLHDGLVTLEALRSELTTKEKLKAKRRAGRSADALLTEFGSKGNGSETAVILFTSGTETEPKAVPLSHHNVLANQRAALPHSEFSADDALFSILPPFHSFGFSVTGLVPFVTGGKAFYFPNPTEAARMALDIERYRPTLICSPPTFLRGLFRAANPEQLHSLRLYITGAEATPNDIFESVAAINPDAHVMEGYGITECSPILTLNRPREPRQGVGRPVDGVELMVVDLEHYEAVPAGEVGLILARGPNVFKGYMGWNAPRPFIAREGKEWYNTGDLGSLDRGGHLILAGRLKRFVKIGGEMISLPALETALSQAAKVRGWGNSVKERYLAVVGTSGDLGRPSLHLFANFFIDVQEANAALKEMGFSNLVRLAASHHLKEVPVMGTGKINYRSLEAQANEREMA